MTSIAGVTVVPLKKVANERGHLLEVQRNDDPLFPGFGQAYITCTFPGVVKAWYRHQTQFDQIALVQGDLLVVCYDARDNSNTRGNTMTTSLHEDSPALIQIPPGIWHGFKAMGQKPAYLLHLNSLAFDFEHTDEERLPYTSSSIPFQW